MTETDSQALLGRWSRTAAIHEAGRAPLRISRWGFERVEVFKRHGEKFVLGKIGGRCRVGGEHTATA